MKKCVILLFALVAITCSRNEKAIIRVKITNAKDRLVFFDKVDTSGIHVLDSVKISGDGFSKFCISIKTPGYFQLRLSAEKNIHLLIFPGEKLQVESDFNTFNESKTIEGMTDTKRVVELNDSLWRTKKILGKIVKEHDSLSSIPGNVLLTDSLSKVYRKITENYRKFSIQYILSDLKSLANIDAIYQQYFTDVYVFNNTRDIQFYKLVSDTLGKYFPEVGLVGQLKDNYNAILEKLKNEKMLQLVKNADNHVPDLTLPGKNGKQLSLSSYRGKVTLLTFWSVGQEENTNYIKSLKRIYNTFHSKGFEIYQVSIDKSYPDWKKAVENFGINWISVCDTAFPNSKTRNLFNVNTLPLNYLINRDQTDIIAKNLQPNELDEKLRAIMK
jgi:peroxiredoxin